MTALRMVESHARVAMPDQPAAAWVIRTSPEDGETFVLRDTPVLLRLSHAVDPASLTPLTLRVLDPLGDVPADLAWSGEGRVLIWQARRLLCPGVEHVLVARGLKDCRGRDVAEHWSRFVPCGLARTDLMSP